MMRRTIPALAAFLAVGTVAHAQTPAPTPAPAPVAPAVPVTEEGRKEAAALTEMIGVNKQSQQLIAIMRGQMIQLVMRAGNKPQDEATKIVDEVLMPDFMAQQNDLTNQIIDVWATNFTVDDLKGLRAFYNTPLGQKLIATLPAVTQQGMNAGQTWGQRIYQASIQKHKSELEARGLKF
ncbi:DUF2059 domain-containing protein [Limobrevibacterium gyesilva]|uniref:DUF2059 domain-containing protein n=1 Tax=Limobrevibacterium gyesilva TaxID=2991712 RepID=A0AA41YMQ7_9PROT|nr:DUF2059 domain-containing protein [Limobrevibacterium gyesilva]MCW3474853.1 DUF2059 domain-containing protein [Limobrevibacterium gyesilva]